MEIKNVILFLLLLLFTNGIQVITGFAGTLLAMPASIFLIGLDESKVILNLITLITCIFIACKNRKYINYYVLKKVIIYMGIGMVLGIIICNIININILLYAYGIIIILIGIKNLFFKKEIILKDKTINIILILAGIIHGMFISGGSLLVVYMAYRLKNKDEFRATMSSIWIILNLLMLITQTYLGIINEKLIAITIIGLVPATLGIIIGGKISKKISKLAFMKVTYTLLLISGLFIFI